MPRVSLSGQSIVVVSNEPWGNVWFSKHNYAYELSKQNKVFFVNPAPKWQLNNIFKSNISVENYSDNLTIVNYYNRLPILNKILFYINEYFISKEIKNFFKKKGHRIDILWSFDPFRFHKPKKLGATYSIFHAVDLYRFEHYAEEPLCENVDFVFCVSSMLVKQYSVFNKPVFLVPHGISSEEFMADDTSELGNISLKEYGLYIGGIDNRLNFELLERILIEFPEQPILFVGPIELPIHSESGQRIIVEKKYNNFYYLEAVHFKKLKYYIHQAKFCLNLRDHTKIAHLVSYHKLLQYLALGKPVFGCEIDDYKNSKGIVYMSNDDMVLMELLRSFLKHGEDTALERKRIEYAKKFTFQEIFINIERMINT